MVREELPYLLDLHLYLGRSVAPAPPVLDMQQVADAAAGIDREWDAAAQLALAAGLPRHAAGGGRGCRHRSRAGRGCWHQ
jgi:hypothetical protein